MATVADSVLARLTSQIPGAVLYDPTVTPSATSVVIFDGQVPTKPAWTQWVVVYIDTGTVSAEGVDSRSTTGFVRIQTTSVAVDEWRGRHMAGWLAQHVRDALVDWVPAGAEWAVCGPILHDLTQMPRRDDDVMERPTVYAIDQFHLTAEHA